MKIIALIHMFFCVSHVFGIFCSCVGILVETMEALSTFENLRGAISSLRKFYESLTAYRLVDDDARIKFLTTIRDACQDFDEILDRVLEKVTVMSPEDESKTL